MAANPNKFRPDVTPETWITPITACRFSTLTTAARYHTLDEAFTTPAGKGFGKQARTAVMRRLRAYGSEHRGQSVAAADGYNREDALYAYRKMYPTYKVYSLSPRPKEMAALLKQGFFLSVSGNVGLTPAGSILRARVNPVPHEIGLARLNGDGTKVLVYEPMRPDKPVWVPWSHVKAFSSAFAFGGGRRVCIGVRIAWATAEGFTARAGERRAKRLRAERDDERAERQAAEDMIESAQIEIAGLERQLEACESSGEDGWQSALLGIIDHAEDMRAGGYEG